MSRAKFQVLVLPFRKEGENVQYCIFKRSDTGVWQFVAGGGENDESPLDAAKREANEEAGIYFDERYFTLETKCSISTEHFPKARKEWGDDCLVIPEYSFAVEISDSDLILSNEHTDFEWTDYQTAVQRLEFDSNKTALWELDNKIKLGLINL